jgi:glucuronate isomerase
MVGNTDDPCDDLQYHQQLTKDGCKIKVLPSFRPDKAFNIADKLDNIDISKAKALLGFVPN